MNITENNKLIAKFMGWKCKTRTNYDDNIKVLYTDKNKIFKYNRYGYLFNKNPWDAPMRYHESWDWLMPVINKIDYKMSKFDFSIYGSGAAFHKVLSNNINVKITDLYKDVIDFIKWYNKNK